MAKYTLTPPEEAAPAPPSAPKASRYTLSHPDDVTPAPKTSAAGDIADAFADIPREIGHQFMEANRDVQKAMSEPRTPMRGEDRELLPPFSGFTPRNLKIAGGALQELLSPLTGTAVSAGGRPIEQVSGGRIPRQAVGEALTLAIPFAQEVAGARDASALAKTLGVSRDQAEGLISRLNAATKAKKVDPTLAANVKAAQRLGIKPSTALASPDKNVRQVAQTLGQNLFVGEPVRAAVRRTVKGVSDAAERAAGKLSGDRDIKSPRDVGRSIKESVERFAKEDDAKGLRGGLSDEAQGAVTSQAKLLKSNQVGFGRKANILYEDANRLVGGGNQPIPMPQTEAALNDIRYRISDPKFVDFGAHPAVLDLSEKLAAQSGRMSFDGARRLRSLVRETLRADPALKAAVSDSEIEGLYQAMSRDLSAGAERLGGPEARRQFEQADRYYRAGRDRIERALDQVFSADTPEKVFYDLLTDAQEGKQGDLDRLMSLRRSLKPDEWRDVASTVLSTMGRALPGQRTMETETSFRTFLTNFNKLAGNEGLQKSGSMADSGLKVLFDGAGHGDTFQNIRDIARAVSQLRESDKLYNHSMSGSLAVNAATGAGLLGSGQLAAMTHSMVPAITAFVGLLGGNGMSLVLENPAVARYLAGVAKDGADLTAGQAMVDLQRMSKRNKQLVPLLAALGQPVPEEPQGGD